MKITSDQITSLIAQTDSNLAGTPASRITPQDVDIHPEDAVQLSQISELGESDPTADVDLEKVAALRQAIGNGSFQVDAQAIYTSLVADAREMQGSAPT